MIHIAHDDRAIDAAFESVLGSAAAKATQPKTAKTYCQKRVAYAIARTHDLADCQDCLKAYRDEQQGWAEVKAWAREMGLVQ